MGALILYQQGNPRERNWRRARLVRRRVHASARRGDANREARLTHALSSSAYSPRSPRAMQRARGVPKGDCVHTFSLCGTALVRSRGGSVAANSRRRARSSGLIDISKLSALAIRPGALNAVSQHSRARQRYAPRPACLPVGSAMTRCSGVRTTRANSFFPRTARQAMHVRWGMCLVPIVQICQICQTCQTCPIQQSLGCFLWHVWLLWHIWRV